MNYDGVVAGLVLWAVIVALELAWLLKHGRRSR
jgi:hypothetical protein